MIFCTSGLPDLAFSFCEAFPSKRSRCAEHKTHKTPVPQAPSAESADQNPPPPLPPRLDQDAFSLGRLRSNARTWLLVCSPLLPSSLLPSFLLWLMFGLRALRRHPCWHRSVFLAHLVLACLGSTWQHPVQTRFISVTSDRVLSCRQHLGAHDGRQLASLPLYLSHSLALWLVARLVIPPDY